MNELEISEEAKTIAVGLKIKHWAGVPHQELFGNISPSKNKSEISQRFYFSEKQPGISVDEAYRFLQNKYLEKEMQAKKNKQKIYKKKNLKTIARLHRERIAKKETPRQNQRS